MNVLCSPPPWAVEVSSKSWHHGAAVFPAGREPGGRPADGSTPTHGGPGIWAVKSQASQVPSHGPCQASLRRNFARFSPDMRYL